MSIKTIERKWLDSFKRSPLVDKKTKTFKSEIAHQLFYGAQDYDWPEDYPHNFLELFESIDSSDSELLIDLALEFLDFIGIILNKENLQRHLNQYPEDLIKFRRKCYYILKTLAHYENDLEINNPYKDNNGDLYFLLRIESGESLTGGQLHLFEDLELPDLYSRVTTFPPGYDKDPVVNKLFQRIESSNKSFFITGKAGTGKSTFIQFYAKKTKKKVLLTAFTGIAAINVGGQTIHSFFRFPLKPLLPEDHEITIFREFTHKYRMIKEIDTIIIDEVSMLRSDLIEAIDFSLRNNGGNPGKPFGGKQILLFGDVFQLPPVSDSTDEVENMLFGEFYKSEYFFDSPAYRNINPIYFEFKKSHRQKDDLKFVELLDKVRVCNVDDLTLNQLNERYIPNYVPKEEDFVIMLTTNNALASNENARKLQNIVNTTYTFEANVTGEFKEDRFPTSKTMELKKNAQVILIKNDNAGRWVNGTIAKIDFISKDFIEIRLENGNVHKIEKVTWENRKYKYDRNKKKIVSEAVGTFSQYPIKLAWAITIHKSQGLTFDNVIIDMGSGAFVNGQAYTALSRCRTLKGIVLKRKLNKKDIIADKRIITYHQTEQILFSLSDKLDPN